MNLKIATASDNARLIEFFAGHFSRGPVEFSIHRKGNFFSNYEIQSKEHITYILENKKGEVEGSASFVFQNMLIQGELQKVGFASDLRISKSRQAILQWSNYFLPTLEDLKEKFGCKYFFSTLNLAEAQTINAFIRPRVRRNTLPRYYLMQNFDLITLHGQFPWARSPLKTLQIAPASSLDIGELAEYLRAQSKKLLVHSNWSVHHLHDKLKRWKHLSIANFIIARNAQRKIVGCVAPWSANELFDVHIQNMSLPAENFRQFLNFGRFLGLSRPLGKTVAMRFLTHLYADNEDVFDTLLWQAFHKANKNEFLSYINFEHDLMMRPPHGWITSKHPYAIYLMLPPNDTKPDFLDPTKQRGIEIEPCFI